MNLAFFRGIGLVELHCHVGSAVSPTMLWEIAHNQGIKLPTKDYWQFERLVTIRKKKTYLEYLKMFDLLEMIQSSPEAMFTAMETAISGAYRKNNITKLELRFNPILRNRQGERDLDHIIVFALQGMERAMLKYPVKAGIILSMDRRLSKQANMVIVKKAVKYKTRGVVGIDLAGPVGGRGKSQSFRPRQIAALVEEAKAAGLGVTVHTGEATGPEEMWEVIRELKPDRIGHGIACVQDKQLMRELVKRKITLETCPTSNLNTCTIKNFGEMSKIYATLKEHGVLFTINTDGPEMQRICLRDEYLKLLENNILTKEDLLKANQVAQKASFINDD